MKSLSAAYLAHVAGELTTLATLWLITRTDGVVMGFTDHDKDIVYSGVTYLASTGYTRTTIKDSIGLAVDNMEVHGVLDSSAITDADLNAGRYDYASVVVMRVNWADLTMGAETLRTGRLGEVTTSNGLFQAELRGLTQALSQNVLESYQPGCRATLFDSRCKVGASSYTVTGTITSINGTNSRRYLIDSGRTEGNGLYSNGKITFTSGQNIGVSAEVKTYTTGQIELCLMLPYAPAIGDAYSLVVGCDKAMATCKNTFNNLVNFRGEPYLPGLDQIVQVSG